LVDVLVAFRSGFNDLQLVHLQWPSRKEFKNGILLVKFLPMLFSRLHMAFIALSEIGFHLKGHVGVRLQMFQTLVDLLSMTANKLTQVNSFICNT